jgi:gas vesicle protein
MTMTKGFFTGLLLGVALGGALAVLYAPEKGVKTRKKLSKRSDKWQETAGDAVGIAGDFFSRGRKRVGI